MDKEFVLNVANDTNMTDKRKKIAKIQKQMDEVCEPFFKQMEIVREPFLKKIDAILEEIANCEHPLESIVEGAYIPLGPSSHDWDRECATPPFRVCKECGYAEKGWGGGYKVLTKGYKLDDMIPTIKRYEAERFIVGQVHEN